MKKLTKEEKEEKKRIKSETKAAKKESKRIKKDEKDIVNEVKKKDRKKPSKSLIISVVIVILALSLLLTSISSMLLASKLNKLEGKYEDLNDQNEKIMKILNSDDGMGDKINNINTDLATIKTDISNLKESNTNLTTKVDGYDKTISNVNNKMKSIDETKLKGLYSLYDWNKSLSSNSPQNYGYNYVVANKRYSFTRSGYAMSTYAYCLTLALKGETPDYCK